MKIQFSILLVVSASENNTLFCPKRISKFNKSCNLVYNVQIYVCANVGHENFAMDMGYGHDFGHLA